MALSFEFVLALVLVYGTSYALKFLERYDVPVLAVEILAGIIFGAWLGVVGEHTPGYEFILSLAAFGLLLIMFDAGLELDPRVVRDDPGTVGILGVLTFAVPFAAGFGFATLLGVGPFAAFLVGVTISTTSLGLVHPLLEDFDVLATERGQVILSVAVLNDLLSVVALGYGITLTAADPIRGAVLITLALAFFLVLVPRYLVDWLAARLPSSALTNPVKFGVLLAVLLAWLMELLGVHAILGGFFAGLLVAQVTGDEHDVEDAMKPVVDLAAPVFFFFVGMQFRIRDLTEATAWFVFAVVVLGIGSKVAGSVVGSALTDLDRTTTLMLAAAMPGRLAISVAAAEIGFARGLLSATLYDAFLVLSTLSVFFSSLAFRYVANRHDPAGG